MAGAPAQNGNSAAGNSDFTRRVDALVGMWKTPSAQEPGVEHRLLINKDGTPWTGGERCYDAETGRLVQTGLPQMVKATEPLWTTPQAHDVRMRGAGQTSGATGSNAGNRCLATDAQNWSTPKGSDGEKGGPGQSYGSGGTPPLPAQAAQWPTPKALTGGANSQRAERGAGGPDPQEMAQNWPTPASRDWKGENGEAHLTNGTGRLHMDQLPNAVAHAFSRPDPVMVQRGLPSSEWRPISRRLFRLAMSSVPPNTLRRWLRGGNWRKRRLNPLFVSALMGWPPGHALCDCSATEFSLWARQMRGALSRLPTASGPWIWMPPAEAAAPQTQMILL